MQQLPSSDYETNFQAGNAQAVKTQTGSKSIEFMMIPLDDIIATEGLNVRVHNEAYDDRIEALSVLITANGFLKQHPLPGMIVKEDGKDVVKITGGFTRLAAAKLARERGAILDSLPVVICAPGTSNLDIQLALILDNSGNQLPPWEKSVVVKRLIGGGLSEAKIADRLGVTVVWVKQLLTLHALPIGIQELVIANKVKATRAINVVKDVGPEKALTILTTPRKRDPNNITVRKALAAINYGCSLPSGQVDFLTRWQQGDPDARAEVDATLRKPRKPRVSKRKAKQSNDDDTDL